MEAKVQTPGHPAPKAARPALRLVGTTETAEPIVAADGDPQFTAFTDDDSAAASLRGRGSLLCAVCLLWLAYAACLDFGVFG